MAQYLNVDLDLASPRPLDRLLDHLLPRTVLLHRGRRGRSHVASLELRTQRHKDAGSALKAFAALLLEMPAPARRDWEAARVRSFDIGIRADAETRPFACSVRTETLRALTELGASLAITVYASEEPTPQKRLSAR